MSFDSEARPKKLRSGSHNGSLRQIDKIMEDSEEGMGDTAELLCLILKAPKHQMTKFMSATFKKMPFPNYIILRILSQEDKQYRFR